MFDDVRETQPRVLIAEQQVEVRQALDELLSATCKTSACDASFDLSGRLHEFRPDVVVLDMGSADPRATEALRRIRRSSPETSVIAMCALDRPRTSASDHGTDSSAADAYLTKPVDSDELVALIYELTRKNARAARTSHFRLALDRVSP